MRITQYKGFQVLTIADIELLQQCFQRLAAEGKLTYVDGFGEFIDVVLARQDYRDTRGDEFIDYNDIGSELVQGPNIIFNVGV